MRTFEVAESSMVPAYRPGDYLLTVELRRPRRGMPVVFPHPGKPIYLLKRIVGLPGDTVEIADGLVAVNGEPAPLFAGRTLTPAMWHVPDGQVFVLSDRMDLTLADSRSFGSVAIDGMARVLLRYRRGAQYHSEF